MHKRVCCFLLIWAACREGLCAGASKRKRSIHKRESKIPRHMKLYLDEMPRAGDELLTEAGWVRIIAEAGETAFGMEFEGELKDRPVRFKVSFPGPKEDFVRELNYMKLMQEVVGFPRVVGSTQGNFMYFFFDMSGKKSVSEVLKIYDGFPRKQLLRVARHLLKRLESLSEMGLVMTSLSEENLLVDREANVWLIGLGLARPLSSAKDWVPLKAQLVQYFEVLKFLRYTGRPIENDGIWDELADYMHSLNGGPDYEKVEKILKHHWK